MIRRKCVPLLVLGSCLLLDFSSSFHSRNTEGTLTPSRRRTQQLSRTRMRRHGHLQGHRNKRGWVWNQFFVLEEYLGPEPQYVGKLHSDMDHGDSEVKYTLSGEGAGSIFTIDQITGDIHALVGLDRSEKAFYTLKAQAVDIHTGLALEPESQFIIKVQDINDNEPRFLDGPYSASVPEMSPTGTFVTQVTATDADDPTYGSSARIVYSIVQGQPYFSVDAKTGVIRTALANMDREVKQQYQVLLQAKDMGGQLGGLASTTTINISLSDVNDNPPRFTKGVFHLHVPESAAKGSSVGRIQAYDQDTGSNAWVDYAIIPGDDGDAFDVVSHQQSQEGVILVKKPLDYETKKSYTFRVEASNAEPDSRFLHLGPFKDSVTVKVSVVDVDEPPVFTRASYVMDVYEDSPPGIIIGSVTAQDLDPSSSAWQTEADGCFDIDTLEGTISTNEQLDRENAAQHNITVVSTKLSEHQMISISVIVNVLDVNEFPPELDAPSDTFMCEKSRVGQIIQTVSAVDRDAPPLGQRFFFKAPKELRHRNFTVRDFGNNTAGIVVRRSGFQQRVQDVFLLPVVVEDSGYPAQSSTSTLSIRVCSCEGAEPHGPLLSCSAHTVMLPVGLSIAALLAVLLCVALLIGEPFTYLRWGRKDKEALMTSREDIRDNVIHYDDEGGGEADTEAFDMSTLRHSQCHRTRSPTCASNKEPNGYGDGVLVIASMTSEYSPQGRAATSESENIREFIEYRLEESRRGFGAPPYDSLATFSYEGEGSRPGSLSSIGESFITDLGDFGSLGDWGLPFKALVSILDRQTHTVSES
uniref:Cadherin-12 n=1 Tax=Gouania willdenowi TaxID=441366 RepID=A0A8C5GBU9_GOUWI